MKAVCWEGTNKVQVETVPDPKIINPRDAIVKITSTAICGSDLHLYDGYNPTMKPGDILGHEFMGEIVELGSAFKNGNVHNNGKSLAVGDRVVVPFTISCGSCFFCNRDLWSLCDNSNPNAWMAEQMMGHSPSGLFGYSHLTGGYAGGQAEYARVPFADVGLFKIPNGLSDDQVLFFTDIFPTGYMAAENCDIQSGDTVAIWGCGPVGQFAIRSAFMLGAGRVIAIDRVPERLQMAKDGGAEVLNYEEIEVGEALSEMTGGLGPDSVMDAVGMEAHGMGLEGFYDKAKQAVRLETDRPNVLRQAIVACRKGGTVSVPGVYTGFVDKMPMGAFMNKGLTMKTGQTHVHRYLQTLLDHVQNGNIDPSFVITHRLPLEQAPHGYEIFKHKKDNCIKIVLKPGQTV
ncbi:glutathione-dependent formaldehyde dehydrogenase [Oculatella sp. LEGE 06141]|uniref:zinc-dependent alcohol dehydrogenase n=1 Tax=Oculatella sp. LEGE 06141 TaxID=1828648 RepID=UPI0018824A8F|nr:zinc-dependent alcohol dehydrogenase [Oculatella sp. LEGE 06141]MBE9181969.1 glutathione-dependent formaldehyde dehydrogenase [Oculatella sp. LEGE 06141]